MHRKLSLGFWIRGAGDTWHHQTIVTAGHYHPVGENNDINPDFPWLELQQHTDLLLKSKGSLKSTQQDEFLLAHIQKHKTKEVAIAACGHVVSSGALRQLLHDDFNVASQRGDWDILKIFFRVILVASHVNLGISIWDVECAKLLLSTNHTTPIQNLAAEFPLLLRGMLVDNILYHHLLELARKDLQSFAENLRQFQLDSNWASAWSEIGWLKIVATNNIPNELVALLNEILPHWRAWSTWNPDTERIIRWEGFTLEQRHLFTPLLSLEGPDFTQTSYGTFREAELGKQFLPSYIPTSLLELRGVPPEEIGALVDRVLKVVDAVCTTCPFNTPLLAYFCVGKIIEPRSLDLLECLSFISDASISISVARILKVQNETEDIRFTATTQLLPFLSTPRGEGLKAICSSHVAMIINGEFSKRRKALIDQLRPRRAGTGFPPWTGADMKLQSFERILRIDWLFPMINYHGLEDLLQNWPTAEDLLSLQSMRLAAGTSPLSLRVPLLEIINGYYLDSLITRNTLSDELRSIVQSLISLWMQTPDWTRRVLGLFVAEGQGLIKVNKQQIIAQIPNLKTALVGRFQSIIASYQEVEPGDLACIDMAGLLANLQNPDIVNCWRPTLRQMTEDRGAKLVEYALANLTVEEWVRWLRNLGIALGGQPFFDEPRSSDCSSALNEDLHYWAQRLAVHLPVIKVLENDITLGSARRCIMFGGDQRLQETLDKILEILSFDVKTYNQPAIYKLIPRLTATGSNADQVLSALNSLALVSEDGVDACLKLMEFHEHNATEIAEVMLEGWLKASNLTKFDEMALECTATLLGVRAGIRGSWSEDSLNIVADYLDTQYSIIMAEAQRLGAMRVALKKADPAGTSLLLAEVNIEDVSRIEAALSDLPPRLLNIVERVSEFEIEMLFSLTHLTQLQKGAIGIRNSQSLSLRLMIVGDEMPPGFCIHLDTDSNETNGRTSYFGDQEAIVGMHSPWIVFEHDGNPDAPVCHGKITPCKYQLTRLLHRHLVDGFTSLEKIHDVVTTALNGMGKLCITCGSAHGVNLRRSTVCKEIWCHNAFENADLDIRLSDIRSDPLVVDLLLTMVFAAAKFDNLSLLPGCPFTSTAVVLQIINSLPSMKSLSKNRHPGTRVHSLGDQVVQLLIWICTSYRGFLTSATGSLKIPSMPPDTHQFLLANVSPEQESDFISHIEKDPAGSNNTRVLFHGTSLDRLFAIICQGLQIKSGTTLQSNGASSGAGIYMAEEPSVSWRYATRNRGANNWPESAIKGFRVVLGCENAGPAVGISGVHVVKDPTTVIIRYVFLIPNSVKKLPIRNHLVTAMLSVFRGLRSGAL